MRMQVKLVSVLILLIMIMGLTACGSGPKEQNSANTSKTSTESKANESASSYKITSVDTEPEKGKETKGIKVKVIVGDQVLSATLIDNATTRSFITKFPLTVQMNNLYSREMVHRFPDPLPANEVQTSGYEVGEIAYWTPRHSFVIFYEQNGEIISNLQKVGRFDSSVEVFKQFKDANVTFEMSDFI